MNSRRVLSIVAALALPLVSGDASAWTQSWSSGIVCVQNTSGLVQSGTLRQALWVGSANGNKASPLWLHCPVPRVSSSYWLKLDVVVQNVHPSEAVVCDFKAVDWWGDSELLGTGIATWGWWTMNFENDPIHLSNDKMYTLDCTIPPAIGPNAYQRSKALGFGARRTER
jgi:hypothetical protein